MFFRPPNYKLILFSILLGSLTSWLIKEEITPLLLGGRSFGARSVVIQIGILISLIIFTSVFFLWVIAIIEKFFLPKLEPIFKWLPLTKKRIHSAISAKRFNYSQLPDALLLGCQNFLKENAYLIVALSIIAIFAYGFELFNFNITIDEEVYSATYGPTINWVLQGRWGMYLLNKFILPYTVIPFLPLSVALVFHIGAVLLILKSWDVRSKFEQIVIGAVSITFPLMAYIYAFTTINYGVGIGLFCIALSLYIYAKNNGYLRFFAFIPAAFAIAIYQGFIPALIGAFLVHIILSEMQTEKFQINNLVIISSIHILAFLTYYLIQEIIIAFGIIRGLGYISGYFDVAFLMDHFDIVVTRMWTYLIFPIYSGGKSVYAIDANGFGVLFVVSLLGLAINILRSAKLRNIKRILVITFSLALLLLPFASGLFMQGYMYLRFLVSLPIVIPGIIMLGMTKGSRTFKIIVALLATVSVFQFIMSTNHLFAASHLSLQADRSLATRLIGRIEDAQAQAGVEELRYMEIIGYEYRPSTELIPKIETIGISYFEFAQGNVVRILAFLHTMGYSGLQPLPLDKQAQMVKITDSMPMWPQPGSVKVVGDVVLVKFGKYSASQRQVICSTEQNRKLLLAQEFCK
jgi:hypothetical protein